MIENNHSESKEDYDENSARSSPPKVTFTISSSPPPDDIESDNCDQGKLKLRNRRLNSNIPTLTSSVIFY